MADVWKDEQLRFRNVSRKIFGMFEFNKFVVLA